MYRTKNKIMIVGFLALVVVGFDGSVHEYLSLCRERLYGLRVFGNLERERETTTTKKKMVMAMMAMDREWWLAAWYGLKYLGVFVEYRRAAIILKFFYHRV